MQTTVDKKELLEELNSDYKLSKEQIEFFRENGFVKLKQVLSKEVLDYYGEIITEHVFKYNRNTAPMEKRNTYDKAFLQIFNLWYKNDEIKEFVFSKRLAKIATELLGVKGVRLYHDQALYKEPGGGITPWHTDQYYWPLESPETVTVWIPLQETPMQMGPLAFAHKSHLVDLGRTIEIGDESEKILAETIKKQNFEYTNTPFDLGEVSYHRGWTLHNAGPNVSDKPRKVMTIIYMDKDMRMKMPENRHQLEDWEKWLSLVKVGEVCAGPTNPILYESNN
ncbi:MAG: phytanoyl-CoA dioxygenase family protein [Cytophagaceae bacterium]|nr:phytanoyl-CoA dioxygenase family protein [Cytophagaceae bacterium]MDW8457094.1 phytanoyl-CoA dioxygenase family protein [Cytophagaceae bacterium]